MAEYSGLGMDPFEQFDVTRMAGQPSLGALNLRALTPFQRALMVIDGNVTKFIEAYHLEPVEVLRLSQERRALPQDHPWLEAAGGAPVIARQVILRGAYSRSLYAYAVSLILPERLSEAIRRRLEVEGEGLGRILLDQRLETFREVLWYGKERFDPANGASGPLQGEFLSRAYRIIAGKRPLMLVNEKFPSGGDALPARE